MFLFKKALLFLIAVTLLTAASCTGDLDLTDGLAAVPVSYADGIGVELPDNPYVPVSYAGVAGVELPDAAPPVPAAAADAQPQPGVSEDGEYAQVVWHVQTIGASSNFDLAVTVGGKTYSIRAVGMAPAVVPVIINHVNADPYATVVLSTHHSDDRGRAILVRAKEPGPEGNALVRFSITVPPEFAGATTYNVRMVEGYTVTVPLRASDRVRANAACPIAALFPPEPFLTGDINFYFGETHSHTVYSGDRAQALAIRHNRLLDPAIFTAEFRDTPQFMFERARSLGYHFFFVTDHSNVGAIIDPVTRARGPGQDWYYEHGFTDAHWEDTGYWARRLTEDGVFVAGRGYEFSRNSNPGRGHMNVLNTQDFETALPSGHTYEMLFNRVLPAEVAYAEANMTRVVVSMNHPDVNNGNVQHFEEFFNGIDPDMWGWNKYVRLFEVWNGSSLHLERYNQALALGWRVGAVNAQDVHGVDNLTAAHARRGSVVLSAEPLTLQSLMEALYQRRVFAVQGVPQLRFNYVVNGTYIIGSDNIRPEGDELTFSVYARDMEGRVIPRVEIIGGRYDRSGAVNFDVLGTLEFSGDVFTGELSVPNTYDFYYALVFNSADSSLVAVVSPIWFG